MDWLQIIYAALGANVFYFLSAPMMRLLLSFDSFEPARAAIAGERPRLSFWAAHCSSTGATAQSSRRAFWRQRRCRK